MYVKYVGVVHYSEARLWTRSTIVLKLSYEASLVMSSCRRLIIDHRSSFNSILHTTQCRPIPFNPLSIWSNPFLIWFSSMTVCRPAVVRLEGCLILRTRIGLRPGGTSIAYHWVFRFCPQWKGLIRGDVSTDHG